MMIRLVDIDPKYSISSILRVTIISILQRTIGCFNTFRHVPYPVYESAACISHAFFNENNLLSSLFFSFPCKIISVSTCCGHNAVPFAVYVKSGVLQLRTERIIPSTMYVFPAQLLIDNVTTSISISTTMPNVGKYRPRIFIIIIITAAVSRAHIALSKRIAIVFCTSLSPPPPQTRYPTPASLLRPHHANACDGCLDVDVRMVSNGVGGALSV